MREPGPNSTPPEKPQRPAWLIPLVGFLIATFLFFVLGQSFAPQLAEPNVRNGVMVLLTSLAAVIMMNSGLGRSIFSAAGLRAAMMWIAIILAICAAYLIKEGMGS